MKAALIPPVPELPLFGFGSFHLLLSHLFKRPGYLKHYKQQREIGAYLVLDNAAHENKAGEDCLLLIDKALKVNAQEIVVPDVLEDGPATVEKAVVALETWFERSELMKTYNPALMYVPQGKDVHEWKQCLHELVLLHTYTARRYGLSRDFVIGLSKDYETWDGGLPSLLTNYILPFKAEAERKGCRMQVHLLGWGRKLWGLREIAYSYPWIRSTDSAKPFVYAMDNTYLGVHLDKDPPPYPKRPKNYFSRRLTQEERYTALANASLFKRLAGEWE